MAAEKVKWDLSSLLNGKTVEELIEELQALVESFKRYRDQLASITPAQLSEALKEKEHISVLFARIGSYYGLKLAENTQDHEALAASTKFEQLSNDLGNSILFFPLWFAQLDDKKANAFLEAPQLQEYHYYLYTLHKEKPYTKSEEVEQIINTKSVTAGSAIAHLYEVFTSGFTYEFDGQEGLTQEEVTKHFTGNVPEKRVQAYQTVLGKYGKESTLLSEMYKDLVLDWGNEGMKIRGYKSPLNIRNISNDIPDKAVDALLEVIKENAGVFAEHFRLKHEESKKKGVEYPFSRYHLYAPYPSSNEKTYPYEETKELVLDTYKQFSEQFYEAAKGIFEADHVHAFPQTNKRGGAFCAGIHPGDIPFILLNHTDTLRDLTTMMHEFGHGIHGMLARKQNEFHYDEAIPMAETASIFGEMLLSQRLLKESDDDEEKRTILFRMLDDQYASIMRQGYFVLFERLAHEKIPQGATKQELEEAWMQLLQEQFGDMTIPEEFKHEWHYIPHIHVTPFYCYGYAWGNLLALSMYALYQEQGETFIEKYTELLSNGGSKSPVDLLKPFGIDPADKSFWQRGFDLIKEEIEELKKLC